MLQKELIKYMKPKKERDHSRFVLSPMPGNVISLSVKAGDEVSDRSIAL